MADPPKKSESMGLGGWIAGVLLSILGWPIALIVVIVYAVKWLMAGEKSPEKKGNDDFLTPQIAMCCFIGVLVVAGLTVYHNKGKSSSGRVNSGGSYTPAYSYQTAPYRTGRRRLGRCTGSAYCDVCSTCSSCAHCWGSGTCGVCSH